MKFKLFTLLAFVASMFFGLEAHAALDAAAIDSMTTGVTADMQTVFTKVLPIVGIGLGMIIGIKYLKRIANKI